MGFAALYPSYELRGSVGHNSFPLVFNHLLRRNAAEAMRRIGGSRHNHWNHYAFDISTSN